MSKVNDLSEKIYHQYFTEGVGKPFFEKFLSEISYIDSKDFLAANFLAYDSAYTCELMLCVPALWQDYKSADWLELLELSSERPQKYKSISELGRYADLQFLCKWLELDGFKLILSSSKIKAEDKRNAFYVGMNFSSLFTKDSEDVNLLDEGYKEGYYACDSVFLKNYKDRVLKESELSTFTTDENLVKKHLESLQIHLKTF